MKDKFNKLECIKDLNNFLIKEFKVKKPVKLSFKKLKTCHGHYQYQFEPTKTHTITLEKRANLDFMITNLQHEWGHLLQNNKNSLKEHTDDWGIKCAKVWRAIEKWLKT